MNAESPSRFSAALITSEETFGTVLTIEENRSKSNTKVINNCNSSIIFLPYFVVVALPTGHAGDFMFNKLNHTPLKQFEILHKICCKSRRKSMTVHV